MKRSLFYAKTGLVRTTMFILAAIMFLATISPLHVWADGDAPASSSDIHSFVTNTPWYDPAAAVSCGLGAASSSLPTGPGSNLEGHILPTQIGGTGNEEAAIVVNGHAELAPGTSHPGDHLALAPQGMTNLDAQYYINMRWRYALWAWRGDSTSGPEAVSWYNQKVRKVLVINPKTKRGIVTSILESGPAPWTGTDRNASNPPDYWTGYVDGTPTQYKGRVSGLAPDAFLALAGTNDMQEAQKTLQRRSNNLDNDLYYEWAPDQNAPAGTIIENATADIVPNTTCTNPGAAGNFVFYSQYDPAWGDDCYGGGTRGNCTYTTIGHGGCGPTSVSEVVATFVDKSVNPKTVADYSTSQGWYVPDHGSSWDLLSIGPTHWGLKTKSLGTDLDAAATALQNGALILASGQGSTPFTIHGHIIVIRGVTPDGKFLLGDPNTNPPSDKAYNNTKAWDPAEIKQGLKGLWAVTRN